MIKSFIKEKLLKSFLLNLFVLLEVFIWLDLGLFNNWIKYGFINLLIIFLILFIHHTIKEKNGNIRIRNRIKVIS